jgi:hypothetical protein
MGIEVRFAALLVHGQSLGVAVSHHQGKDGAPAIDAGIESQLKGYRRTMDGGVRRRCAGNKVSVRERGGG